MSPLKLVSLYTSQRRKKEMLCLLEGKLTLFSVFFFIIILRTLSTRCGFSSVLQWITVTDWCLWCPYT